MSLSAFERKVAVLEAEMAAAVEREDYEAAARLRDQIAELRGLGPAGEAASLVRKPPPGQMGIGTSVPVVEPPKGWVRPKKPDLMTKNIKSRKR